MYIIHWTINNGFYKSNTLLIKKCTIYFWRLKGISSLQLDHGIESYSVPVGLDNVDGCVCRGKIIKNKVYKTIYSRYQHGSCEVLRLKWMTFDKYDRVKIYKNNNEWLWGILNQHLNPK